MDSKQLAANCSALRIGTHGRSVFEFKSDSFTYDNGPLNRSVDAWTINSGFVVSDTFTLQDSAAVSCLDFVVWALPGDTPLTVDWSITSDHNMGTKYGSGTVSLTNKFLSTNQFGYLSG